MPVNADYLPVTATGAMFVATCLPVKVAATTTISYITNWQITMCVRLVIISVACGAFRLVCGEWPCNNLVVCSMAVNTKYAGSVIARIIRRIMCKVRQW